MTGFIRFCRDFISSSISQTSSFCKYDTSALLTTSVEIENENDRTQKFSFRFFIFRCWYSFSISFMENSAVFSEEAADEIEKNHVFHVYEQISDHFSETRYDHKEI